MTERLNRRQFFSLHLDATVGFLGNFLAPQLEVERDFFRPPGTYSELDFLTSCNRCSLCKDACPENIIKMFSLSDGAELVNTPFINPNEAPCTFCYKCIDTCPSGALSSEEKDTIGVAKINKHTCLAFKDVMCNYCVYACPVPRTIQLNNGKPEVNRNSCNGCGECVSHCISETKGIKIAPAF